VASRKPKSTKAPRRDPKATSAAIQALLESLGVPLVGEMKGTPKRVAALWHEHLLAAEGSDPGQALGRGSPTKAKAPVTLLNIGVHLVCPHHLTVAFGLAHVAYVPNGRAAGFGAIAKLVRAATARMILQEDAGQLIADTLVEKLGAHAAVAFIDAVHPCHNVPYGRSHRAEAATWGAAGEPHAAKELRDLIHQSNDCGCDDCH